ncbi:hypothetical protein FHS93_003963, partial [Sphingobium francense]
TLEMAPLEIRHRSVRPISAKHAQASRFLQQSHCEIYHAMVAHDGDPVGTPTPAAWDNLVTDNFVAAVDLTLDVTDNGGVAPNLSFIHPLPGGTTLNRTLSVVGQYSRSRDDSVQLQYIVDLAVLAANYGEQQRAHDEAVRLKKAPLPAAPCADDPADGRADYLGGDLRLHDTLADGLASLEATSDVSLYGTSGPTGVIASASKRSARLDQTIRAAGGQSPAALVAQIRSVISPEVLRTLDNLASAPTVSETDKDEVAALDANVAGLQRQVQSIAPAFFGDNAQAAAARDASSLQARVAADAVAIKSKSAPSKPAGTGAAQGIVGATSFQSIINFAVTYGASGGPNWTLVHFKGPGGGAGGGGPSGSNLLGYTRTHSDNLKITFSPTCRSPGATPDDHRKGDAAPLSFWAEVPVCTGTGTEQKQIIASGAQTNNVLTGLSAAQLRR